MDEVDHYTIQVTTILCNKLVYLFSVQIFIIFTVKVRILSVLLNIIFNV